jgi:putative FmdB family regulatory protein
MPLYEYECEAAGHRFEVIQKFSDAPIDTCRVCGSPVHKLQSAPAFHLKGTGWYATDYAKTGSAAESKGGKDGKDTQDSKDSKDAKDSKDGKKTEGTPSGSDSSSSGSEKPASGDSAPTASTPPAAKPDTPKS